MISQILTVSSRWQFLMLCVIFQFLPALEPYGWRNPLAHVIVHCISNCLAFLTIPKPNSKLTILNTSFISFLKKVLSFGEKCYFGWNKMLTVTYLQRRQDLYGYLYFRDKKREMRNATPLLCKNTSLHKKSIQNNNEWI